MEHRVVLITGASGGIGGAAARRFANGGDHVAVHYHKNKDQALALVEEINSHGGISSLYCADLTSSSEVKRMFNEIESQLGNPDVLVNAAGYSEQNLFQWITDEQWQKMMAINLDSVFYTCREALPSMIEQKKGWILNVSSIWGISGASMEVHYATAKAAVIGMTKALAKEAGPSGVVVNCIAPGWIDTDMNGEHDDEARNDFIAITPMGRTGTVVEIAEWIYFLCSSRSGFLTGQVISPNGGVII